MNQQSALASKQLAGLYLRLSEKDKGENESESIDNQRKLLTDEAKKRGFYIVDCYVDDGFTGTNFDRPSFLRLIHDIDEGKINVVMTKDLSRFGRNYTQAGYYQEEYFPERGVRYIAVLDGYDSENEYSTASAPWMNVANEQYAKDISKKIRGAFKAKMHDGQFIGNFAPYGYQKQPQNKNHLIVDEESASVVRRIFSLILEGFKPSEIAERLNADGIPTPAQYRCQKHDGLDIRNYSKRQEWVASSISKITRNATYTGSIVHNRQRKVSYKSKSCKQNPKEVWIINENAHEAIISPEIFEAAQRIKQGRLRRGNTGFKNIFSGVAFCADCGKAMSAAPTRKWQEGKYLLSCGAYKLYGSRDCTNHFIDYSHLCTLVYDEITNCISQLSVMDWEAISEAVKNILSKQNEGQEDIQPKMDKLEKQIGDIDATIQQLYEDRMHKVISEERFQKMLDSFEEEQKKLTSQVKDLQTLKNQADEFCLPDVRSFVELAKKTLIPPQLTREMLYAFVDRIYVHQGTYEGEGEEARKHQKVSIHLKFLGLNRFTG